MVNPGNFPIETMADFQTPGLTLFAVLPGPIPIDGVKLFNNILSCARSLAADLNGELQDETHSRLTNQTIKHIYSQIIEYQRQTQLAMRRSQQKLE
jgi:cell division protein ZipA